MSPIFLETLLVTTLRAGFFFSCRKLLLHSLYSDLRDLSGSAGSTLPETPSSAQTEFDLSSLPTPSTHQSKATKDHLHSTISRLVFSACFSESCTMFMLLMFQAFDIFNDRTRLLNWRISLFILMIFITLLVPLSLSLILTAGSLRRTDFRSLGPKVLLSLIPVIVYVVLLSYIPLPPALSSTSLTLATSLLSRLVVLGTIILGLLSGFGAISNSWQFIPTRGRRRGMPSEQEVNVSEQALYRVRNDLAQKRLEVQRQAKSSGSWFSRMIGSGDGNLQELAGLEALEYQMTLNLESQKQAREDARFSSTFAGRLFNIGGMVFAFYCAVRILSSIIHIVLPWTAAGNTNSSDLITDLLAQLVPLLSSKEIPREQIVMISRDISLLLVGVIILTSIRMVLRGVTRALRVTSRNLGASFMLLFLAQLMGIYLLSTLIQLRTTFPPQEGTETNLFSSLPEYQFFGSLFDWSFVLSAAGSAAVRWGAERVSGVDKDF